MSKSASEVMQSILIAAVTEAIEALKAGAKGLPNNLLRDIQSVHPNAAFNELPKGLQDAINLNVRSAFNELLKEGYAVGPKAEMQQSRPLDRVPQQERRAPTERRFPRSGPGRRDPERPGGRPDRPGGGQDRPGGGPGRPGRGPRPGGKPKP